MNKKGEAPANRSLAECRERNHRTQKKPKLMHEVHLVREIVDNVEQQAKARGAKQVRTVKIRFNRLTSHSGEHVRFSFDIVKKESALVKDAALDLTEVAPLVRCRKCGHTFEGNELPEI